MWNDRYSRGELNPTEKTARRVLAVAAALLVILLGTVIYEYVTRPSPTSASDSP